MSAIRLARAATRRNIIIKFEGCYHGHSDGLLVKAGSGVATLGIPGSAGVPDEIAHLTLALPYNDLPAVEAAFAAHPNAIAAIILEPVVGNAGCIAPAPGYLAGLRDLTQKEGTLLIVDEVMTGFRVALGGACQLYSLDPDLITLGKIVGGGLPVGVFGGKRQFMDLLAPLGPVYQAGTLSGNPLAMAAGIATLSYLQDNAAEVYAKLESTSKAVFEGVVAEAAKVGIPLTTNRVGSMGTWFFTGDPVTDYDEAAQPIRSPFSVDGPPSCRNRNDHRRRQRSIQSRKRRLVPTSWVPHSFRSFSRNEWEASSPFSDLLLSCNRTVPRSRAFCLAQRREAVRQCEPPAIA
jgi:glutamate-1-semialdehyde 2,1-aminomutase